MIKILSTLILAATLPLVVSADDNTLPPVASEVLKLSQSQVGSDVVKNYIQNSTAPCNLTADQIIALRKAGVADDVVTALLRHSGELQKAAAPSAPVAVAPAPAQVIASNVQAPPPMTVTTNVTTVIERPVYAEPVYVSPGYYDYYYPRSSISFSFGIPFGRSWGYGFRGGWGGHFGGHGGHR